ncbi:MAG: HlyD family secretion protein [Verrucomicrobiota bacterium]
MDEPQRQESPPPAGPGQAAPFWLRRSTIIIGTAALAAGLVFALGYVAESFTHESTDDAFVTADVVSIAPRISGQVKSVAVEDNQLVHAGDLLAEIDPRDYDVQAEQKQAAQASAEANVKLMLASLQLLGAQVETAQSTARESEAKAAADKATAEKAEADLKRAEELMNKRIISSQEYDSAKAAAVAADATLTAAQQKALSDQSKVAETRAELEAGRQAWERAIAQAQQSRVDVKQASLNQSYTRITAPQSGRITRKSVQPGDYVQVGQRLMALVSTNVWVVANFKETQLDGIRTNQPVKIEVDALGGRTFPGHVQSLQAGSGAAFSLLPPENAVGNYVKVVQRVPVKIVFDTPPDSLHTLGPGMSVVPLVRVTSFVIPEAATIAAGLVLAGIAGFTWWRLADRKHGRR